MKKYKLTKKDRCPTCNRRLFYRLHTENLSWYNQCAWCGTRYNWCPASVFEHIALDIIGSRVAKAFEDSTLLWEKLTEPQEEDMFFGAVPPVNSRGVRIPYYGVVRNI